MKFMVITGTRTQERRGEVTEHLNRHPPDVVLVGDATGVDEEARAWAKRKGKGLIVFHATGAWPGAGPRRNALMALVAGALARDKEKDHLIHCEGYPVADGRGTQNCMGLLRRAGLCVTEVTPPGSRTPSTT